MNKKEKTIRITAYTVKEIIDGYALLNNGENHELQKVPKYKLPLELRTGDSVYVNEFGIYEKRNT